MSLSPVAVTMRGLSLGAMATGDGCEPLLVAALATPIPHDRRQARVLARDALATLLGQRFDCAPTSIRFSHTPGEPLCIAAGPASVGQPGLSVSHETGLSLVAVNVAGRVGVDLLDMATLPGDLPTLSALAETYLGPTVAGILASQSPDEQRLYFARQWTDLEARLKCLGLGLDEWSPALQAALATTETGFLELPQGFVGSLAVVRGRVH